MPAIHCDLLNTIRSTVQALLLQHSITAQMDKQLVLMLAKQEKDSVLLLQDEDCDLKPNVCWFKNGRGANMHPTTLSAALSCGEDIFSSWHHSMCHPNFITAHDFLISSG
jgi:hypothetical protein